MRPQNLKTRIFLDGGDPVETTEIKHLLGFSRRPDHESDANREEPDARKRLEQGKKFTDREIFDFYRLVAEHDFRPDPGRVGFGRSFCRCIDERRDDAEPGKGDVFMDS